MDTIFVVAYVNVDPQADAKDFGTIAVCKTLESAKIEAEKDAKLNPECRYYVDEDTFGNIQNSAPLSTWIYYKGVWTEDTRYIRR